jgi:hypothetical protein
LTHVLPLQRLRVGIVVERRKAKSAWIDHVWVPVAALAGEPDAEPWTVLGSEGETTRYYAGSADVDLFRTETANYRDNLTSGSPLLWVVLEPAEGDPPYALRAVTADPAEGESHTEAGNNLIETVPMPEVVRDALAAFVAEHHVEREFFKRKRDRADPDAMGRRGPRRGSADE